MNTVLFISINIIKNCSIMLIPVIPESSNKILDIFNIPLSNRNLIKINEIISDDINIIDPVPVFPRIEL